MKKKTTYKNEPIELEIIDDFLPSPDKLILKEENVKVTISLSKQSIEFFKKYAKKGHVPYQKMIRKVLDSYVMKYQK